MLIGVDHGNKQIKTVHCNPFVSGLKQSVTRPFGQNVLRYQNTYYTLSTERIPYRKDKTEDDRFFILTLFALAGEIEARGAYSSEVQRIQLAVGLPPAHFGAQVERFTQYFGQRGMVEFEVQGKPYSIYIEDVACFPQAYAAAATMLHALVEEPKAVILDIGGFTADYLLMKNGEIDLTSCDSLENGVILLYNKVRSKVNSELDLLLDEGDVDAILMGKNLKQSVTRPFGQNVLRYQNTYYTLSTERIPYRKDKTEDDRFFILTLFALAGEIEARGAYSTEVQRIQLAVGLPPAHFGAQVERFTQYFGQRGMVEFEVQGKPYTIYIEDVACFPQAYAAAATMLHTLVEEPKAVILDIGGFTADYLLMKNGEIDLTSCDSLENGVILLYNKVRSKVNSELDLLLDEGDVDAILMGKKTKYPDAAIRLTEQMAQEFISDLFSTLRERMIDLQYCKVVFVGGGAILLKRQIETSGKVGTPFFVPKINANADGYEYLYRIETAGR